MEISIIIPARNSEKTIRQCLDGILTSDFKDFEVIAVDDNSTDRTYEILKNYNVRAIKTKIKIGTADARNEGVKRASGDIFVFIDSDVVIKKETLTEICKAFKQDENLGALTGLLSKEHPNRNFFSQFKNLYMNFIFNRLSGNINFLYGSIHAIKRKDFELYDKNMGLAADTDLGHRLSIKGVKLTLVKDLEVIHLKKYNFSGFIKNDFKIPFYWVRISLKYKFYKKLLKGERFAHSNPNQLMSIPVVFLSLIFLVATLFNFQFIYPSILTVILFFIFNFDFFRFLKKEKGLLFLINSIFVTYLDMLVMGTGILAGAVNYSLNRLDKNQYE